MGIIGYNGFVKIFGVDYEAIKLCKIIEQSSCSVCRKRLGKGSICLGKGYAKTCIDCANELFINIRKEFGNFLKILDETEQDLNKNKEKYEANNLASNI